MFHIIAHKMRILLKQQQYFSFSNVLLILKYLNVKYVSFVMRYKGTFILNEALLTQTLENLVTFFSILNINF